MSVADPYPKVRGRCPACGLSALFVGSGGYVTCGNLPCPDPAAATEVLHGRGSAPHWRYSPVGTATTLGATTRPDERDPRTARQQEQEGEER